MVLGQTTQSEIIVAGGSQPGADAKAAYGEIISTEEDTNYTTYMFSLLNGIIKYAIDVDANENVVGIHIYGMDK